LVWIAAAACGTPAGPGADVQSPDPAFDWVGQYAGTASGSYRGTAFSNETVELTISFGACGGIEIRFGSMFSRCGFSFGSAIAASFSYDDDSLRRSISFQKFSATGPGDVLLGAALVERIATTDTLYHGQFNVQRR
jgi:hypothetical protein